MIDAVLAVLVGKAELPPKGAMLGVGTCTVCDECERTRNVKKLEGFTRIQEMEHVDPELCLLEQGLVCNGPATASGCGALCPAAGAPCVGCYGPSQDVLDYGARMVTSLASVIDERDPERIDAVLDGLVDPTGCFYRFSLAKSVLGTGRASWNGS